MYALCAVDGNIVILEETTPITLCLGVCLTGMSVYVYLSVSVFLCFSSSTCLSLFVSVLLCVNLCIVLSVSAFFHPSKDTDLNI